ncbi:UNVERIFIED_CONTAM: hypothetical protein PYX00_007161 [Menopon gallinae]|uniref:NADP-dependent oxidoreductase domain-containing protein n=1 Tax=Menopon gallinae TaxID=328185 RepID=A0AAW2HHU9_9NEOP
MNRSVLLSSGYHMPVLGLGTWKAEPNVVEQAVLWALEVGYRLIDTAYNYGNEEEIGKAINKWIDNGGKREDLFITTKLPNFGNRPCDVNKYLNESLKRLDIKYIDLYLIHHPFGFLEPPAGLTAPLLDKSTDHLGIWKEMEQAVRSGLTKSIGLSNFNSEQIEKIVSNAEIAPANLQVELHAFLQQPDLLRTCRKHNIAVTAFAPLGSPAAKAHFKTKYDFEGNEVPNCLNDAKVLEIAERLGKTPAQILLRFLIQQGVIVVPKSSSKERILENYQALSVNLGDEDMAALKCLDRGEKGRIFDFLFYKGVDEHPEYPFPKRALP